MSIDVYTFEKFQSSNLSENFHYLVVGHPISHSLSPIMHNLALQHHGIDAHYVAVDLYPHSIPDFISRINKNSFLGCNITIPYKQQFLSVPDFLSEEADALGAINTIAKNKSGSEITGYNTDIIGFQHPLLELIKNNTFTFDYGRAIVFGTGGASLAVQYALWDLGFEEIILVSRTPERVNYFKSHHHIHVVDYFQWQQYAPESSLIINSTPLGMGNQIEKSVISETDIHLTSNKICYDLVYNPLRTRFLNLAADAGAVTINGLDMLIHQGSRSFEIWTGHTFPIDLVRRKLLTFFK